ncbi:MAG: methyltransferase domain-containing protein [Bacteroidota bacterium]
MENDNIIKAAQYWDKNVHIRDKASTQMINWLNSPLVGKYCLNKLKVGDKIMSVFQWLPWVKEKYIPEVLDYGLSFGCGDGTLERQGLSMNICKEFDAFDISKRSISIAVEEAKKKGVSNRLHYQAADINHIKLETDKYNIVFFNSAMHHFHNLEHVIKETQKSLGKNGLLVANEFIGPSQFQWTEKQLQIMNELLQLLPLRLRYEVTTGRTKLTIDKPTVEHMNTNDPSEAIRSAEIITFLENSFEIIERVDFGGTILHYLLHGIIDNFDASREDDIDILKMLGYIEDILIRESVLSSDFTIIVARNKK